MHRAICSESNEISAFCAPHPITKQPQSTLSAVFFQMRCASTLLQFDNQNFSDICRQLSTSQSIPEHSFLWYMSYQVLLVRFSLDDNNVAKKNSTVFHERSTVFHLLETSVAFTKIRRCRVENADSLTWWYIELSEARWQNRPSAKPSSAI